MVEFDTEDETHFDKLTGQLAELAEFAEMFLDSKAMRE